MSTTKELCQPVFFPGGGFFGPPLPGDLFSPLGKSSDCEEQEIGTYLQGLTDFFLTTSTRFPAPPAKIGVFEMTLPTSLNYPIIAIADLHGQLDQLERLVTRLELVSEWDDCALVFLGDFVDRGEDVPGTIDLVLDLLSRRPGGSAILGNHDLALVRAARLDDGPPSPYWIESYLRRYDHDRRPSSATSVEHRIMVGVSGRRIWRNSRERSQPSIGRSSFRCPGWSSRPVTCSCTAGCRSS